MKTVTSSPPAAVAGICAMPRDGLTGSTTQGALPQWCFAWVWTKLFHDALTGGLGTATGARGCGNYV